MTSFAVILARGGSKGVPKKNMTTVAGMPLLYWSIKAAYESRVIERVTFRVMMMKYSIMRLPNQPFP